MHLVPSGLLSVLFVIILVRRPSASAGPSMKGRALLCDCLVLSSRDDNESLQQLLRNGRPCIDDRAFALPALTPGVFRPQSSRHVQSSR